ncbi:CvpA family protein [Candidatus Curtissbacteria bacterium]|nr:CvpA family protein [Candidatus Curtissbacteria bacterium]
MNWVDLVILLVVFIFALEGQRRGFFAQLIDILGFFTSLVASLLFYPFSAQALIKLFSLPKIAALPIGFLLIWVIVEIIFFTFFEKIFRKTLFVFSATKVNRLLGFAPATANALLFLSFALLFVVSLPIRPDIKKDVFDSNAGSKLIDYAGILERPLNNIFGPIAKQGLTFLTVKPEEKGSINLEFKQNELRVDTEAEKRMFELVNEERAKVGVRLLVWDESLANVGRKHSEDMFRRGYFSHYSSEGKDVGDRLAENGIGYTLAGENLALAPDVSRAHTGLINSEGHRRNILDPTFKKLGVGAQDGGIYGKMFTQVFTD